MVQSKPLDVFSADGGDYHNMKLLAEIQRFLDLHGLSLMPQEVPDKRRHPSGANLVHALFEDQAAKTPHAVAVQFEQESHMTYAQLNELANAVARQLVCGRGTIVPICMDRSINMIVSLLAVMKTGAAYVLVSPEYPLARKQFILQDTNAPFVLVDAINQGTVGGGSGGRPGPSEVVIEKLIADAADNPASHRLNLDYHQSPSDLAYIIYTSGTTGRPKGAMLSHLAACSGLLALPRPEKHSPLRQLLCHSPVFSAAQRTILGTLVRGGTLCLASKENVTTGLIQTIRDMKIESLEITPTMLRLLTPEQLPESIKKITLGGESVSTGLAAVWADKVELYSAYGLSECTQLNMRHRILPSSNPQILSPPTDTTTLHILLRTPVTKTLAPTPLRPSPPNPVLESTSYVLSPAPVGVPAELYLSGPQLANGYLNLPSATALSGDSESQAFITNPFGKGKLYRTGDVVILRENGTIELLGRRDFHQVKISGQRIEVGEVASVIDSAQGIKACSVVGARIRGTASGEEKSLVGILVLTDENDDKKKWVEVVNSVKNTLRQTLQDFAIPRYWLKLDSLPVNSGGKTDLAGLVRLAESMEVKDLVVAGMSSNMNNGKDLDDEVREVLAGVLSLDADQINAAATFHDLGGSSLDAIVLVSRLRKIGVRVEVADVLQNVALGQVFSAGNKVESAESNGAGIPKPFSLLPTELVSTLGKAVEDAYPVTPLQEGILTDSALGRANYTYRRIYRLQQHITEKQVRRALNEVVRRNPILRTTFQPWKRSFTQIVHSKIAVPWSSINLAIKGDEDIATALDINDSLTKVHPGLDAPLVTATMVNSEYLVVEMHHALFDFWSSQFLFADMDTLLRGQELPTRAPFSAYVAFQQQMTTNTDTQRFWREYLASAPENSIVETSNADPLGENLKVEADLGDALVQFSNTSRVALATIVHQLWALTLAKHLSSDDVVFMTAFSGRDAQIDDVLALNGPTLCTVPFRVVVEDTESAEDQAKELQKSLWRVASHAHVGVRNATAAADVDAGFCNTMVNVLAKPLETKGEATMTPIVAHGDNFTQYITLEMEASDPQHVKLLVPSTAQLSQTDANSLVNTFAALAKDVARYPQSPIANLLASSSLSSTGTGTTTSSAPESIIAETPMTLPEEPEFALAHSAFEQYALTHPTKPAIHTPNRTLSYHEFNTLATRFAQYLLSTGTQPGDMIPLYMEKSPEMLVAIFGILKAGAAFVPLDPRNPYERNMFIINDTGAKRIVTDEICGGECEGFKLPVILAHHVIISNLHVGSEGQGELPVINPNAIAYAIYTSGSTGTPKGVIVPHSAVDASTRGMIEATNVTSDWVALWVLNAIFDAAYYDVFTLFSCGGILCVAPQEDILSDLAGYINRLGVKQVMLTPTLTKLIRGGPDEVPAVEVLNVCGERIDVNVLEWARKVVVYNGYGPTEATILMTVSKVEPDGSLNSIGYPMRHVTAAIVPADGGSLERVPNGEVGELCVRGPQLAKGYLNRPEQTSAAFITDYDGEPLYRTGDLARWAEDGSLHCLGRKDYQVKLNGFRIELGEIENAMLLTGKVEASVVSIAEIHGKRQLVAFCIFAGDQLASGGGPLPAGERHEIVADLAASLTSIAHYMMPSLFLPFRSFPTLPSGKADRKTLVKLVEGMAKAEIVSYMPSSVSSESSELVPVSTKEEIVMREAWSVVLGEPLEAIGANSVFLSLGGDSIAAINVAAQCRQLAYSISVAHILASPTLAEQAKFLTPLKESPSAVTSNEPVEYDIPLTLTYAMEDAGLFEDDIEDIYPCGPGQIEFLEQGKVKEQFWNLTTSRPIPEGFDLNRWKEATVQLTAANHILRACYYQVDESDPSSWYQVILKEPVLDWEEAVYTTKEEKDALIQKLRNSHFTLGKPNIKYLILHSATDASRTLCIKVDHGSYDGTLLRIFDDQFRAIIRGENLPQVEPFKNFIDFTHHHADRQSDLDFWKSSLESYQPTTSSILPSQPVTDRLKIFPLSTSSEIDSIATRFRITPATLFQAIYSLVAARLTAPSSESYSTDILLTNLTTGRNLSTPSISNPQLLNGTLANFLPFRTVLDNPRLSIAEYLKQTQSDFWTTTEHGNVNLAEIRSALGNPAWEDGGKLLFCFQPFVPPPVPSSSSSSGSGSGNGKDKMEAEMRWVVMAKSQVFMTINYALMVEVQKTAPTPTVPGGGYRLKMQWDSAAFDDKRVEWAVNAFDKVFESLRDGGEVDLQGLMGLLV